MRSELKTGWLTVTSFGLPVAPGAVTRIVPVREVVPEFRVKAAVIVPLAADWIHSHVPPDMTNAVQAIVPVPVFVTVNVVGPASAETG